MSNHWKQQQHIAVDQLCFFLWTFVCRSKQLDTQTCAEQSQKKKYLNKHKSTGGTPNWKASKHNQAPVGGPNSSQSLECYLFEQNCKHVVELFGTLHFVGFRVSATKIQSSAAAQWPNPRKTREKTTKQTIALRVTSFCTIWRSWEQIVFTGVREGSSRFWWGEWPFVMKEINKDWKTKWAPSSDLLDPSINWGFMFGPWWPSGDLFSLCNIWKPENQTHLVVEIRRWFVWLIKFGLMNGLGLILLRNCLSLCVNWLWRVFRFCQQNEKLVTKTKQTTKNKNKNKQLGSRQEFALVQSQTSKENAPFFLFLQLWWLKNQHHLSQDKRWNKNKTNKNKTLNPRRKTHENKHEWLLRDWMLIGAQILFTVYKLVFNILIGPFWIWAQNNRNLKNIKFLLDKNLQVIQRRRVFFFVLWIFCLFVWDFSLGCWIVVNLLLLVLFLFVSRSQSIQSDNFEHGLLFVWFSRAKNNLCQAR